MTADTSPIPDWDVDSDSPQPDAEPKQRKQRADKGVPRGPRGPRKSGTAALAKKLRDVLTIVAGFIMYVGEMSRKDPSHRAPLEWTGLVLTANAESLSEAYAPLVAKSAAAKRLISTVESGGTYGRVIIATASVALPVAAFHGLLPHRFHPLAFGLMPDDVQVRWLEEMSTSVDASETPSE